MQMFCLVVAKKGSFHTADTGWKRNEPYHYISNESRVLPNCYM